MKGLKQAFLVCVLLPVLSSCNGVWNSPYSDSVSTQSTLFSAFSSPPKHLDSVVSYNANEWSILSQIVEPPLQYHYFKQPYTLEPLTLETMPSVRYLNNQKEPLKANPEAQDIGFSEYTFNLKKGILFQPHAAFLSANHRLSSQALESVKSPDDIPLKSTRELIADDFVFAIKRMAKKQNHSPILDSMANYIVGLKTYSDSVSVKPFVSLRESDIEGVEVLSSHQYRITIKGRYPQFLYWLSMNFFAPVPWEAIAFYKQPGLVAKNITLDTYPIGTGAYQLIENNPNKKIHLSQNPNYHHGFYPSDGLASDTAPDLLNDAGKPLPFIKNVIYSLEKESIPLWNKFLQGYYDASGVSNSSFEQAISVSATGSMSLTQEMKTQNIQFLNNIEPTIFYLAFNMADSVVGGYTPKQQKLRQAISLAINFDEYISIFLNGRGVLATSPIPSGIFGYEEREEPTHLQGQGGESRQQTKLKKAKRLLAQAGYPNGIGADGKRLTLHYDTASVGPDSKSQLNWYRKQFTKLGIELVIRATDYNRFQDKVRNASVQLFSWGWNADYPDPENFLFLLSGENAVINTDGAGINGANYDNPIYNALFQRIKLMENSPKRLALIKEAVAILKQDAPWVWGYHPQSLVLHHNWVKNVWANPLANNTLKYKRVDAALRSQQQGAWNQPIYWPLIVLFLVVLIAPYPLVRAYRLKQKACIQTNFNEEA